MYQCPNCGAALRFDIPSQQMKCDNCGGMQDPYEIEKASDAEERQEYDVTVFTCPQCGGEVMSTDNAAASFCSYCGASTILNSRIEGEKKPSFIIPFQKTKDDCKAAYKKMVARTLFAPRELTDPQYLDKFRGFYMPYWVYVADHKGPVFTKGERSYRRGNYIYTDHYNLSCDVDATYRGMSYDASSSFDDAVSETIAPYDSHGIQKFSTAYLSGFFADTADVPSSVYVNDAKAVAEDDVKEKVRNNPDFHQYGPKTPSGEGMMARLSRTDSAMFPVWFLTYRKKDRVAYAFVNGQTGKISCDMPVDLTRFLIGSLILSIPIFLLLNAFLFLTATGLLSVASVLSVFAAVVYLINMRAIRKKETHAEDKGKNAVESASASGGETRHIKDTSLKNRGKKAGQTVKQNVGLVVFVVIALFQIGFFSIIPKIIEVTDSALNSSPLMGLLCMAVSGILMVVSVMEDKKIPCSSRPVGAIVAFIGTLAGFLTAVVNPVEDIYYYACVIFMFICMLVTLLDLTEKANILATRPLPAFERKGGDQRG